MKIIKFTKNMSCDDIHDCSDNIVTKLESKFAGIKLMIRTKTDTVHGGIHIRHASNSHTIKLICYEKTENPNNDHTTTLKKYADLDNLTETTVKNALK